MRSEPKNHTSLLQDLVSVYEFNHVGWFSYFIRLNGYDKVVAVEFLWTFKNAIVYKKGLQIETSKAQIGKVSRLPTTREHFLNGHDAWVARAQFSLPTDNALESSKQGTKRLSLPGEFLQFTVHIIRYITCE